MKIIKIRLDYLIGPVIKDVYDKDKNILITGVSIVDNDEEIRKYDSEIAELYSNFYEFDSHGVACYFNRSLFLKNINHLKYLLNQLLSRLNEINDGTFCIDDQATNAIEKI